jgi:hypothetical protein
MPTPARIFHLYRERNWTAERIARQYPSTFRDQWDVYALLKRHGVGKVVLTPACAARARKRERVQAKALSRVRIPPLEVGAVLLRCWSCKGLSQQARCPHCFTLINPIIETDADRMAHRGARRCAS